MRKIRCIMPPRIFPGARILPEKSAYLELVSELRC